jgi:ABC-2 type transport system ATP-binding protein
MVTVKNLTKTYGGKPAVDNLSLEVREGELFGLVGPDGAGKTTAIRLMLGILTADSGEVRVDGRTGYVSQRFSLYGDLTVQENLELFADLYAVSEAEMAERTNRLMQFSRLDAFRDRLARNLSGGMKQKLALSCALIHTPNVLFLDEPTTGVDPLSRRDLWRLLFDLWQSGVTIIVSTPYMDEAERCSRVGFLSAGKLMAAGRPDELRSRFDGVIFEVIVEDKFAAQEAFKALPFVRDVNVFGEGLHVIVDADAAQGAEARLRNAVPGVRAVSQAEPSMEDLFFQLTERSVGAR